MALATGWGMRRTDKPKPPSDERPDRRFEDWEPLEDLLTTLAVR
jgi:hypothetical protein